MAQNFTTDTTQWQGVDDEPTAGSHNLAKSGGIFKQTQYNKNRIDGISQGFSGNNISLTWIDGNFWLSDGTLYGYHAESAYCQVDISQYNGKKLLVYSPVEVLASWVVVDVNNYVLASYQDKTTPQVIELPINAAVLKLSILKSKYPKETAYVFPENEVFEKKEEHNVEIEDLTEKIDLLKNKKTYLSTDFTSQVDIITGKSNQFYRSIFKQSTDNILTIKGKLWASTPGHIVFCAFDANGTVINNSKIIATRTNSYVDIDIDIEDDWKYYSMGWITDNVPSQNDSNAVVYSNKYADEVLLPSVRIPFTIDNKYVDVSGNLIDNSDTKSTEKIPVKGYDTLYLDNVYIGVLAYGVFWDANGYVCERFQNKGVKKSIPIPERAVSVQLCNFKNVVINPIVLMANTTFFQQPFSKKAQRDSEILFKSVVRKPFAFNGKTAVFTGDSITYGFITPETTVYGTGDYPTLFSNAVGMSHTNIAVGGSTIKENAQGATEPSITQQVKNASKNVDYLFIAGGTNDWQLDMYYDTFKQAVDNLCDYINANYAPSVQVIWITPINNGGRPYGSPMNDLQIYRNIMTTEILGHDTYNRFSIIQGNEAPFPSEYDNNPDGVAIMFGDKLHPSAIGYQWYSAFLKTLLL